MIRLECRGSLTVRMLKATCDLIVAGSLSVSVLNVSLGIQVGSIRGLDVWTEQSARSVVVSTSADLGMCFENLNGVRVSK